MVRHSQWTYSLQNRIYVSPLNCFVKCNQRERGLKRDEWITRQMPCATKVKNKAIRYTILWVCLPDTLLSNQVSASQGLDSIEASRRECSDVHQYASLCWRDVWQLSVGAERKEESSVLSQRRETAHCVNDKLERGTRTLDFNADIRSLRGGTLLGIRQTLWCFHRTWESSYRVGFKALVSSFNLARAARHPLKLLLCFAPRVFKHPSSKRGSGACPVGGRVQCAGCEPKAGDGRWKKNRSVAVTPLGCKCKVTRVINPFWRPLYSKILSLTGGQFGEGHQILCCPLFKEDGLRLRSSLTITCGTCTWVWKKMTWGEFNNLMQSWCCFFCFFQ